MRDIPEYSQPSRPDMLPREMVRQAVLIAARDELGLATRDQVIDETPADPKKEAAASLRLSRSSATTDPMRSIRRLEKRAERNDHCPRDAHRPWPRPRPAQAAGKRRIALAGRVSQGLEGAGARGQAQRRQGRGRTARESGRPAHKPRLPGRTPGRARRAQGDPRRWRVSGAAGGAGARLRVAGSSQ